MKLGPAALLLLAPFAIAAGQRPADRIALDRLHDSLRALTPFDTATLRTEYRTLSGQTPSTRAPLTTLQSGLVALRLGELGADADFGEALASLRKATRLESDWPALWHLLGVAASRRGAWEQADPRALGNRVGVGTLEHAAEYYAKALSADPGYARAADSGNPYPWRMVVGDFNHDQHTDIAVVNHDGTNVGVLLNDGSGGF